MPFHARNNALRQIFCAEIRIDVAQASKYRKYKKGFLKSHLDYVIFVAMAIIGVPVAKILYQVFVKEVLRTCSSKKELVASLRSK